MEQSTPHAASFCDFQVTVAEIEERSGLKLWIGLPLEVQTKLKLAKGRLPQKIGCRESAAVAAN
jgi:endonuclease G